jgi:hypothetical protein
MKRIFAITFLLVSYFSANFSMNIVFAETGKEVFQACAEAMKFEKLKEFKTLQLKAYLYVQGQKIGIKVLTKGDENMRFEQTVMGREEIYVSTEESFFKLKPIYEELDKDDASYAQISQMLVQLLPPLLFGGIDSLDEEKASIELVGTENFNGKSCKKVRIAPKELPPDAPAEAAVGQIFYFDAITNWLLGIDFSPKTTFVYESMKKVKGYVYPTVIKLMNDGKKVYEIEIDKIEADIELNDNLFAKP